MRRVVALVAVISLLGACSSNASPSPPQASPTPAPAVAATATPIVMTPSTTPAPATETPSPAASASASAAAGGGSFVDVTEVSLALGGGFAVDAAGDIYAPTGTDGSTLVKLAPDGTVLARWAGTDVIAGQPDGIGGLVLDPASGDVFVVDSTADRVVHLSADLEEVGTFGETGVGPGQFTGPTAIALDPSGHLLVVDTGNNRIETFTRDGTFVSTWDAPGGTMWPVDLSVDARGDLVVSGDHPMEFSSNTPAAGQVVVFSPERKPLLTLTEGAGQPLFFPQATVDRAGNILVEDGYSELLSFSPTGTLVSHWELWSGGTGGFVRVAPSGQVHASGCFGTDCRIVEVGPTGEVLRTLDFTGPADHPGSKVATGQGYDLYLQCAGSGSPTVVLEAGSGMGGSFAFPGYLLGRLATTTRVCLYDRAGLGLSDPAPYAPSYAADVGDPRMIADLHAVLQAAGVKGPYVMVGHSLGGPLNRLFAATYPEEVMGMVQVDPSTEDSDRYRGCTDASCPVYSLMTALSDAIHGKIAGSLGALPLIVLTHDPAIPWLGTADANFGTAQDALATASSNAVHVVATRSSHFIPFSQPGLVIEAIREVVAAARAADHSLPKCGAAFTKLGGKCL